MYSDSKPEPDSGQRDNDFSWDLPSSSLTAPSDVPGKPFRKKYRSKSAVSNDPRSPYYTSQGLAQEQSLKLGGRFTKAPSVSCVPGYDCSKYPDVASKSYLPFNGGIPGLNLAPDDPKAATIRQHYYPEGGWGYVVCFCAFVVEVIASGLHSSFGLLLLIVLKTFAPEATFLYAVSIGATSISISLILSPVIVALCKRNSTRLLAILGGLVGALGCLFTSFASQFHQLFFSYGFVLGSGISLMRGTLSIIVGQYFKKKRELVEIFVISGTSVGMAILPFLVTHSISTMGWRLGLQTITGLTTVTFLLGVFYRPASLYHPQRRAILHLKGLQKRSKAKDKNAHKEKPPFFDFGVLKSRTVQILILGSAISAFGINVPIMILMHQGKKEGLNHQTLVLFQIYLGIASCIGNLAFGFIVVKNSMQCLIAKQYLMQASCFMMGATILAFLSLKEQSGYSLFVWIYGFFYGGYLYSSKTFTFEKVRARNFARAWGFIQCSQAIPTAIGLPLSGYLNELSSRLGFYFASACIFSGGLVLFLIDVHKRNVKKQKNNALNSTFEVNDAEQGDKRAYYERRISLQDLADEAEFAKYRAKELLHKQELTCISEEVLMDNYLDYVDDCITSCNKEEKYLMLSEFENNLINTQDSSSSQEVRKALARERKISTVSRPLVEQCPNCFRVVPIDGGTTCNALPAKNLILQSMEKKNASPRKNGHKESIKSDKIIKDVSSIL